MADPPVYITPTEYTVTCVPEDTRGDRYRKFRITVQYRGNGRWAVLHQGYCLGRDEQWEIDSSSTADDDHRFDLDTAVALAKKAAPKINVNGWTVQRALGEEG